MDRALSSERRDFSSSDRRENYYGPGGGGGYRRGRGRGRGRGGFRRDYQPYRRGPPRRSGNRFQADQQQHGEQKPVRQLLHLLNQVGALKAPDEQQAASSEKSSQRTVVAAQAQNIQALTDVLCGSNAEMFLKHDTVDTTMRTVQADKIAGPLAAGLVHCASVWPLQTPCYASLTLAVQEYTTVKTPNLAGVGKRCLDYITQLFCRDLDRLILEPNTVEQPSSSESLATILEDRPRAVVRLRLMLRYLALLASTGMLQTQDAYSGDQAAILAATNQHPLSVGGLLDAMTQAAIQAAGERYQSNHQVALVLAILVWSTIPYTRGFLSTEWITENLVEPLQEIMESYQSSFAPGVGTMAILLKGERHEDVGEDNDDEEEEEEEEDDEVDDAADQICDSLQDLLRSVKHSLKGDTAASRFTLFTDAPWKDIKAPVVKSESTETANDGEQTIAEESETSPLSFTGEPMALEVFPLCKSLSMLLGGEAPENTQLAKVNLNGIVFGRLPIFGPPPEATDDEEDEEMEEEEGPVNERLQAYRTGFGMVDRFFLGQAVRDCLISHENTVTDAGVEHGSIKSVAEQVWSLRLVLDGESADGIEYCILEAILSLITQCTRGSPFRLLYLSRVLLELTRIEPSIMSPAIALGVSTLFQDYMPALVPKAGYNLSQWFAFHLTNTDYQWPSVYWKHWEPFVLYGWSNSRGAFVKGALSVMTENLSNPELLVRECLPKDSAIVDHLFPDPPQLPADATLRSLQDEIERRIWENGEDPDLLLAHLVSEEIGETIAGVSDESEKTWGRTNVVVGALMSIATQAHNDTMKAINSARPTDESDQMEDSGDAKDVLLLLIEKIEQYKKVLEGVMAKDASSFADGGATGSDSDAGSLAELYLLEQVSSATSYSRAVLEACIDELLQQKLVQVTNVLKWCLGETSDGSTRGTVLRWWDIAVSSVQHGLLVALSAEGSGQSEMDIEKDGTASEISTTQTAILNYLDPLLSYMIQRVSSKLFHSTSDKPNKLSPEEVDLTEGFKYVALECQDMYCSTMHQVSGRDGTRSASISTTALYDALLESAIAGPKLASLVDAGGSLSADMLRRGLERM